MYLKPNSAPTLISELPLSDIIGWDVGNWSKCLLYWIPWLENIEKTNARILVLGERNGGISLWLALLGFRVICSDYVTPGDQVKECHSHWKIANKVTYQAVDVFRMQYPTDYFDVVACKSVIGGLKLEYKKADTRTLENQKLAVEEIRRVLKPGGLFLGAENLVGTRVHALLRCARSSNLGWRHLGYSEISWLFNTYSQCQQLPWGFLGTNWNLPRWFNSIMARGDAALSSILPKDWLYISFIRARK